MVDALIARQSAFVHLAFFGVVRRRLEGTLCRAQTVSRDRQVLQVEFVREVRPGVAFLADDVLGWDPHVVERDPRRTGTAEAVPVPMAFEDLEPIAVAFDDEHGEPVAVAVIAGSAHRHEEDVSVRREVDEPLFSVDDPLVAVPVGAGLEVSDVRPAVGFGKRLGDDAFTGTHRREVLFFYVLRAVFVHRPPDVLGHRRLAGVNDATRVADGLLGEYSFDETAPATVVLLRNGDAEEVVFAHSTNKCLPVLGRFLVSVERSNVLVVEITDEHVRVERLDGFLVILLFHR